MAMSGKLAGGNVSIMQREGDGRKVKKDRDKAAAIRTRQRALGRELRRMYDDVVQEPVPDEFLEILHKIDQANGKKGNETG